MVPKVIVVVVLLTTKSHTNRSHVLNIFDMRRNIFKNIFVFCKKHDFLLQLEGHHETNNRLNYLHLSRTFYNDI